MAYEHKEQNQTNKMCIFPVIKELHVKAVWKDYFISIWLVTFCIGAAIDQVAC